MQFFNTPVLANCLNNRTRKRQLENRKKQGLKIKNECVLCCFLLFGQWSERALKKCASGGEASKMYRYLQTDRNHHDRVQMSHIQKTRSKENMLHACKDL